MKFCRQQTWLDEHATFTALYRKYQAKELAGWPVPIRNKDEEEVKNLQEQLSEEIELERFLQYLFFTQWHQLKEYCNNRGILIIGDFPFFMNYVSADVWANPEYFKLTPDKMPYMVAGSPPDSFSEKGQLFNGCVYDWERLKDSDFSWWVRRLKHLLSIYDIVRVDHFRGLVAQWEIPAQDKDPRKGRWDTAPFYEFMSTLLRHLPTLPLFGEDLGVITADVREGLRAFDIPGIKMLLFAFSQEMLEEDFLPHKHVHNCVVYTGTHDTNTCQGWYERTDNPDDKTGFFRYLGREVQEGVNWEFIRLAMMSVANTAIIPLQDVLGLGGQARMNTPGETGKNWQWRFEYQQLTQEVRQKLVEMTEVYGRG